MVSILNGFGNSGRGDLVFYWIQGTQCNDHNSIPRLIVMKTHIKFYENTYKYFLITLEILDLEIMKLIYPNMKCGIKPIICLLHI